MMVIFFSVNLFLSTGTPTHTRTYTLTVTHRKEKYADIASFVRRKYTRNLAINLAIMKVK